MNSQIEIHRVSLEGTDTGVSVPLEFGLHLLHGTWVHAPNLKVTKPYSLGFIRRFYYIGPIDQIISIDN